MMRFSRRRSSLSFSSSVVKTGLNANHAGAFLHHSAVSYSSETTWSQVANASKPKRDESWTECVSIYMIDRFPEITGEHRKCSENGEKPNQHFPIVCRSICWGLSSVSVIIEMQQTPSTCTTFTSNELLELWMLLFSPQCFTAAKFVFFKMNDSEIMGVLGKMNNPIFPEMNLISKWNQT